MELKQELGLRQTLSQNMILSARILQMGRLELREYLGELQLNNPVVELEEPEPGGEDGSEELVRQLEELMSLDAQNRQYYQEDQEEVRDFEAADSAVSLEESILEQVPGLRLSREEERIFRYFVLNLDENGWLSCDFEKLCEEAGISPEQGQAVWESFKRLEPGGVGARCLRECLLMQLEARADGARRTELAAAIIRDCLEDFGKNRMRQVARRLGCRLEEALEAGALIRELNPRPAAGFANGNYQRYIVPDVLIVRGENGFEIVLNEDGGPLLRINPYYVSLMKSGEAREAASYIRDKVRQAQWVCQCVDQRKRTLFRLAEEILRVQQAFFEEGRSRLAPMTQKEAAQRLGLNESTVSRAVHEKYLQCRWGIFPLQFFFSRGVKEESAGDAPCAGESAEAVRERLRGLIDGEDKKKPYSDRLLAEKLAGEGISISRRTVAKYREAMGIRDASGRREFR